MPSDSEEPKQKKVKTDESAAAASNKSEEEDVSVDVQRNDDGTCLSLVLFVLRYDIALPPKNSL